MNVNPSFLRRWALCGALALALGPHGVRAEAVGVLAAAPPPGPGPVLAALTGELRAALAARAAGVLPADALRGRLAGVARADQLAELDRAYAAALSAHLAGDYDSANRTLRSIADALERLPDGPEVLAAWTRAMLRLARSEQELGRVAQAQAVVERVLRAAPDTRAEPRQFPPSFLAMVDQARARLRAAGTRRLTVEGRPGARVFVEGREVGAAPVTVDVAPGRYRVSGLLAGVRSPTTMVEVSGDRVVQLDLALAEVLLPDAGPGLALADARQRPERAGATVAQLGLDRLVLVWTVVDGAQDRDARRLGATLVDVQRAAVVREARVPLDDADRPRAGAVDALAAFVAGESARSPVEVLRAERLAVDPAAAERILGGMPGPAGLERPSRIPRWAAIGTGVAAVGAGAAAVLLGRAAQSSYDAARAMRAGAGVAAPHTVSEYNALIDRGDRQHRLAIGTGIAAGVSALTSAALWWWSGRTNGDGPPASAVP